VLCIGKEEVFDFVQGVLTEISELFPSNLIHIGGDEVPKNRWKECIHCQSRIKNERLSSEEDLQVYFTNRIAAFLRAKGNRVMGWNEILDEKLKEDVICQYWIRRKQKVLEHIKKGGYVVMSNYKYAYLDQSYSFTPLKLAYDFEPIPKNLTKQYHKQVLGLEALMWGEFIPNIRRLEWQTFPRLIAFSEVGWTQKDKRNFESFQKRLDVLLKRFDLIGINYANKKEVNPLRKK
jgi:hexosaminidase